MPLSEGTKRFFGIYPKQNKGIGSFKLYDKHNATSLKEAMKSLRPQDRQKLAGILKEEKVFSGGYASNRQMLDMLKRRGEKRDFINRFKTDALTKYSKPGISAEAKERNVNYINAERVRSQREAELKKSGLAPDPSIAHKAEQEVNVHLPV